MAAAQQKPWRAIPGGGGDVLLFTVEHTWADAAVRKWADQIIYPIFSDHPRKGWTRWALYEAEAKELVGDLMKQARHPKVFGRGVFHVRMAEDIIRASRFGVFKGGLKGVTMEPQKPTLYFMHAPGCDACRAMKPVVAEFYARNKDRVKVVPIDLSRVEWKSKAWEPELTPTLILRYPDGKLSKPLEGYEEGKPRETFKNWFLKVWQS